MSYAKNNACSALLCSNKMVVELCNLYYSDLYQKPIKGIIYIKWNSLRDKRMFPVAFINCQY